MSQEFMLTAAVVSAIIFLLSLLVVAVVAGRLCWTCFNRGYIPVYCKSTQTYRLRMNCPSCAQDEPSEFIGRVLYRGMVEKVRELIRIGMENFKRESSTGVR